ncbi:AbrB family transcriptional regulator [Paragemmobacter straminiformis]|uniref:AbrB family transcriptional regulator n=1 Tax=Paragemmobacter straminiformis TaxID=2045119 RepID=A0A842I4D6_9RHOB|nr:AbrB family transcriptional regulator [Gemmobacter straminiformis]MBC2835002.1 AbrB family transcriptional regulator [Gemmobacter straminiformis]
MKNPFTRIDPVALGLTLALGAAGGLAAKLLHLPIALLLGSLVTTGVAAASGWRPFGKSILLPMRLRLAFVPVIGVSIGGAFTPAVLAGIADWWPSLLALFLFLPLSHAVGYAIYRRGGLPRVESFFGAVPGGLIETVQLGEEAGGDVRLMTVLQFLRLILTIIFVPLIFTVLTGGMVGSASGISLPAAALPLSLAEVAILLAAGVLGFATARALHLPAAIMTGPILFSATAHAAGIVHGVPPAWLVGVTQIVIGCGLGARFAGVDRRMLARAFGLAAINAVAALLIAFAFALTLSPIVDEPAPAVFLSFAPGGLAEMSLIALSLQMSLVFVTLHHIARIILSVTMAKLGMRWLF